MEDQRKKYLLNRIKKQELVLHSQFDKFKRVFQNRALTDERNDSYIDLLTTIVDHNNEFALGLIEYLQKNQIKDIFQRSSALFNDLMGKYKKVYVDWKNSVEGKDMKQIRQICQICQEKIESNHIQNIKNILDRQAEARSNLIKKLIEETEKERVKPLFTNQEDALFKQQLDKVLKKKETSLESNQQQSNIFLQTVAKQISDFMVSFRDEFSTWEHNNVQENLNWAESMKRYLNKKLTNSFQDKIPKWIKKMHEHFVLSQPVKPKIYFANREVQTMLPTDKQISLKKQVEELKKKLELKEDKLKQLFIKIELQKSKNQNLEKQLSKMQKYMVQKIYEAKSNKKNESKVQSTKSSQKAIYSIDQKEPLININSSRLKEIRQIPKGTILPSKSIKNVQKLVRTPIKKISSKAIFEQAQKENIMKEQKENKLSNSDKKQSIQTQVKEAQTKLSKNQSIKNIENNTYRTNNNKILKQSLGESQINQTNARLKKKGYNRDKRQEIVIDKKEQSFKKQSKSTLSVEIMNNLNKMPKAQLEEQVKNVSQVLKRSSQTKKILNQSQVKIAKQERMASKSVFQQIQQLLSKYLNHKPPEAHILQNLLPKSSTKEDTKKLKNIQNMSVLKHRAKVDQKDERYSKSLHVDRHIQDKHKAVKLPKIVKNQVVYKSEDQQSQLRLILQQSCLDLFIDNQTAYNYQQSLNEISKNKKIVKPTSSQLHDIEALFSELQALKRNNKTLYNQIISFLKHPHTAIKCQFLTLDVINELSFPAFCNYFLKILWLHKNCIQKQNQNFCGHITTFIKQTKVLNIK